MEKGTYGYMDQYKKKRLTAAAVYLALIAAAFIAVLCIFKTNNTYFIAIPIVLVLPFAKQMVGFLVVQPFHSMPKEEYEKVEAYLEGKAHIVPVYDVTLASEDGFSYLDFVLVLDGEVYGCAGHSNKKFKASDMQAYLQKLVKSAGYQNPVFVYEELEETLQAVDRQLKSIPAEHSYQDKSSKSIKKAILVVGV